MKYAIHPSFAKLNVTPPLSPAVLRMAAPTMKAMLRAVKIPKDLEVRKTLVSSGERSVPVEIYAPKKRRKGLPCLLYFHGGAFCFRAAPYHKKLALRYARELSCAVVFPDYCLLPRYPFPAAQEDALAVGRWLYRSADSWNFDKGRIAVGGDSAGAVLAAAVCAKIEEPVCLQMLLYPVTDVRMQTVSMARYTDTPMWNAKLNARLWEMYLKDTPKEHWSAASPMQMPLPREIPDTYIETAEFDCLHDEGVLYAKRLKHAGGKVTLYEPKGTVHGYDFVLKSPVTEESVRRRIKALRAAFREKSGEKPNSRTLPDA